MKNIIRLFLCGDVMTGRGIDQILPHPNHPELHESYVKDARDYVYLAEEANGKINYPVSLDYIWGDAINEFNIWQPDVRMVNLETAITTSHDYMPDKGIHYRMHPDNIGVLTSANIDICILGNNHVLDWGKDGLMETISTLNDVNIRHAGAGVTIKEAIQPAVFNLNNNNRILVFSAGMPSSGVPHEWMAKQHQAGVNFLPDFSEGSFKSLISQLQAYKSNHDLIVFSIHWGSNWGYDIPDSFRQFAHALIDSHLVDIIYGHSSHHPRPIEIYHHKPILYGCGDFINDYEGISGHEQYRGDLSLMYFIDFDADSLAFKQINLIPMHIRNCRLSRANEYDSIWLMNTLNQPDTFCTQFKYVNRALVNI